VTVVSSSDNVTRTGVTAANLTWRVCLQPQTPGGPFSITVTVQDTGSVVLNDILFGEVWLASGQSNCAFATQQAFNSTAECAAASLYPNMRVMTVAQLQSNVTLTDFGPDGIRQRWSVASPSTICGGGDFDFFPAMGYFFARELINSRGIPVGVIASTVPGTSIELWSSPDAMAKCNSSSSTDEAGLRPALADVASLSSPNAAAAGGGDAGGAPVPVPVPVPAGWEFAASLPRDGTDSYLYNGMIAPLLGVAIRGAVWWQGESNVGMTSYACRFPTLIQDWREKWTTAAGVAANFPFLFVQLSPYYNNGMTCIDGGNPATDPGELPLQRIVQTLALSLPNVGMASAVDIGDAASPFWPGSVHPRYKQPVAARLALEARRIAYGESGLVTRGPQISSVAFVPDDPDHGGSYHGKDSTTLRLYFSSVGGGIVLTQASFAQVSFVATYNDSTRVPGTILPTNVSSTSVDVYLTPAFGADALFPVSLDALWFDFPVVPLFNSAAMPLEPFRISLNSTALACARRGLGDAACAGVAVDPSSGFPLAWQSSGRTAVDAAEAVRMTLEARRRRSPRGGADGVLQDARGPAPGM
jgi:hypothetical protein